MSVKDISSGQPHFDIEIPTKLSSEWRKRKKVYEVIVFHEVIAYDTADALCKMMRPQDPEIRITKFSTEALGLLVEK